MVPNSPAPNPFSGLAHSRKFWLLVLDTVITNVLFFGGKYAGAQIDDLKFLIAAYQPVFVFVITMITVEDTAKAHADAAVQAAGIAAQAAAPTPKGP